ncbi:hypothetical protein QUF63_09845 [Anaerolineales bacterium HSG25]|nr:hypothetical protein [Anaerolineales bacterium HSG25]
MLLAGIHILHTNGCPITTFGHDIWEVYFLGVTQVIAVAAGRPICQECVQIIEGSGGMVASAKKK